MVLHDKSRLPLDCSLIPVQGAALMLLKTYALQPPQDEAEKTWDQHMLQSKIVYLCSSRCIFKHHKAFMMPYSARCSSILKQKLE